MNRVGAWRIALPPAILTLLITSVHAGRRLPWSDELATWHASTIPFEDFRRLIGNVDAVIAPYYLFMRGWVDVFGDSPGAMRAPSIIAMTVAAAIIALIGRRLVGDGTGLLAGVLFALVPSTSRFAQEARPYALALLGVVLATWLLLRVCERPTRRGWVLYAACVAAAGLMHVVTLTVLLAHGWIAMRDGRLRGWVSAAAVGVVCVLPLAYVGSQQDDVIQWITADVVAVRRLPRILFGGSDVAVGVIALGLLAALVRWRRAGRETVALLLWAVVPPVFCYVTFDLLHVFLARYVLFTVPAWVLLVASLAGTARARRREIQYGIATLLVAALAAVGLDGQRLARSDPLPSEPAFRAAAAVIDERALPGDGVVFAGASRIGRRPFLYLQQHGDLGPLDDVLAGRSPESQGRFRTEECRDSAACLADVDRIWVVSASRPGQDVLSRISPRARAILESDFDRSVVARLPAVRVFLLTRVDAP